MINRQDMELIKQFMGSYFHQDWDMEFGSAEDAIKCYKSSGYADNEVSNLANALRIYAHEMRAGLIDKATLFKDFSCFYDPSIDGLSEQDWVESLADYLDKE